MKSQTNLFSLTQVWKEKGKPRRITESSFFLLVMLILVSTGVLAAEPPIVDVSWDTHLIGWEYDQIRPATAYGSQNEEYLTVWEDHHWGWGNDSDIYGRRINADGALVSDHFGIAYEGTKLRFAPDVAYNPTNDEFLVVYEYEYSSTDHDIYARRVGSDGTPVGNEISINISANFDGNPVIAYNSVDNEYLIVWERRLGSDEFTYYDIYAQRVSITGTSFGTDLVIASGSPGQSAPAVAYGGGIYLVVWQDKQSGTGDYDIHGRRLGGNGSLIGNEISIAAWEDDQLKPRLTFNSNATEFFIVWEDHDGTDWDIYGGRVGVDGTTSDIYPEISSVAGDNHHENPDVSYNPIQDRCMVFWNYEREPGSYDVVTRDMSCYELTGSTAVAFWPWGHKGQPIVVADDEGSWLFVWEDGRNAATQGMDLYCWLMWYTAPPNNNVYLPIILRASP